MNTHAETPKFGESASDLQQSEVPVGTPLDWPIVDADGMLLFDRGAILGRTEDLDFLFQHFQPRRGDLVAQHASASPSGDALDHRIPRP
jgi:hypothetical protein